jgi:2-keto-4-pentenoate hydratase
VTRATRPSSENMSLMADIMAWRGGEIKRQLTGPQAKPQVRADADEKVDNMALSAAAVAEAAEYLWSHWMENRRGAAIPEHCRPRSRSEGYAIGAAIAARSGMKVAGWKIAATSTAGQKHINVDGPLAGRLLSGRMREPGGDIRLGDNIMNVAELEFAFRFGRDLPAQPEEYLQREVMAAVESLHLSCEVPDSRYTDFTKVGANQLIADTACAYYLCVSEPVAADWRGVDLAEHKVAAGVNGTVMAEGAGKAALGDPRIALTWLVNEVSRFAGGITAGDIVTTGTCVVPVAVKPGDRVRLDYGPFGALEVGVV